MCKSCCDAIAAEHFRQCTQKRVACHEPITRIGNSGETAWVGFAVLQQDCANARDPALLEVGRPQRVLSPDVHTPLQAPRRELPAQRTHGSTAADRSFPRCATCWATPQDPDASSSASPPHQTGTAIMASRTCVNHRRSLETCVEMDSGPRPRITPLPHHGRSPTVGTRPSTTKGTSCELKGWGCCWPWHWRRFQRSDAMRRDRHCARSRARRNSRNS